jgi:hypothetical protein
MRTSGSSPQRATGLTVHAANHLPELLLSRWWRRGARSVFCKACSRPQHDDYSPHAKTRPTSAEDRDRRPCTMSGETGPFGNLQSGYTGSNPVGATSQIASEHRECGLTVAINWIPSVVSHGREFPGFATAVATGCQLFEPSHPARRTPSAILVGDVLVSKIGTADSRSVRERRNLGDRRWRATAPTLTKAGW